ncbi:Calcium-dependent protein kinase 2, partial [Durusdinium trenchii]
MFLVLGFLLALFGSGRALQEEKEKWWDAGQTQMNVWDHSWLTPRLVCGFRFMRVPLSSGLEGKIFIPIPGIDELSANSSGAEKTESSSRDLPADQHLSWVFDGTRFQDRASEFYQERNLPPPMEDVWLLVLIAAVPTTVKNNVMSGGDMMELQCSAMVLLSSYFFAEYMIMLVPPAVLLKYFQHTWEVHSRVGHVESADEMVGHFNSFEPLGLAMERFQEALQARSKVFHCDPLQGLQGRSGISCPPQSPAFGGSPVLRPLVDVLIIRCREDLGWVLRWLSRVLRDEWTPEVAGVTVRLVIYEKCDPLDNEVKPVALDGQQLLAQLLHIGAIHPGSTIIALKEPEGFEHVAYVHYCMSKNWRDSDFVIFLHGFPFDHTNEGMLDDVLRSMVQGTYGVPFVHLNINRLPRIAVEPCLQVLIRPALEAWQV